MGCPPRMGCWRGARPAGPRASGGRRATPPRSPRRASPPRPRAGPPGRSILRAGRRRPTCLRASCSSRSPSREPGPRPEGGRAPRGGGGRAGPVPGIGPAPPASLGGGRRGGVPPPSSVPGFHGVSRAFHARGPTPRAMDAASRRSPEQGPGRRRTAAEPLGRCAGAGSVAPVPPGGWPLARSGSRGAGAPPSLGPRGPRPTEDPPPRRALRSEAAALRGRTGAAPAPLRDGPARGSRPRPGRPAPPFRP